MAMLSTLTNNSSTTYDEVIDGERVRIEPGQSITMPRRRAIAVRGHYCGSRKVSLALTHQDGGQEKFICHLDGLEFSTREALEEHLRTHMPASDDKIYVAPDGREFKSKSGLLSYLRSLEKKSDDSQSDSRDG